MIRVIVTVVDGIVIAKLNGNKEAAQSYVRKIKTEGIAYKGTHYGPAGIVKIEVRDDGR